MKKSRLSLLATLSAGLVFLAGCASTGEVSPPVDEGTEPETTQIVDLNVGITPIANAAVLYVGIEQGFFEEVGLNVQPEIVQNTSTAVPSLINGELDFALINVVAAVTAGSRDLPITIVSGSDRYPADVSVDTTALIVKGDSDINEVADLEGKTIAVVGLKSAPDIGTQVVLRNAGLSSDDVSIVELAYPDMVDALNADRIDAAFIVDPFLSRAKGEGARIISQPFTEGIGGMSAMMWLSSKEFVANSADVVERFNTAVQKAATFSNDNPDAVRAVFPEFTSLSEEAIKNAVIPSYDPSLNVEDLEEWNSLLVEYDFLEGEFDATQMFWDNL